MPNTTRRNFISMCGGLLAAGLASRALGSLVHSSSSSISHSAFPKSKPAAVKPLTTDNAKSRTVRMLVTAYCPCKICCGANARGITASGIHVADTDGKFVAADTHLLPFGTKLSVPGYHDGQPVEVIDRGGAIQGKHIDVFFPSHEQAKRWGARYADVTIVG